MNLNQLRYFLKLAEEKQYTKAAKDLHISQPTLSYAVSQLEEELGVKLIEKDGHTLRLTVFGSELKSCASESLHVLDEGIREIERKAAGAGKIRLGFLRTLGNDYIPRLAAKYMKENPDKKISFCFHTGATISLLEKLDRGEYDIVFASEPPDMEFFNCTPIMNQDLVLIVPEDHPLAGRYSVALRDTLAYPYIYFDETAGLRHVTDMLFKKIGQRPTITWETDEDEVIAGMVANGFGISLVPYSDSLLRLKLKILQISAPKCTRDIFLITSKKRSLLPAAAHFREFLLLSEN